MVSGSIVITCLVIAVIYFWSQAKAIEQGMVEQEYHLSLENLSQKIDARIASMKLIAFSLANDKHIHHWVDNGFAVNQESILVEKLGFLVNEYGLTSASFADKNTHKYWNHEGFLRVLQAEVDTWYFAYLASNETDLISVYHDKNNNRVDVYVNYQQPDGNGLSGIATSFDGVVDMLTTSLFAEQGEVYLVDSVGQIQVHANAEVAGNKRLQDLFVEDTVDKILQPDSSQFIETDQPVNGLIGASYIPSMNWYVVVHVTKM
jgi:methyl-accepting chemotaxis protein